MGAGLGGAFALAVITLADCAGPHCTAERAAGLLGHALVGAVLGAVAAGIVRLLRHSRR